MDLADAVELTWMETDALNDQPIRDRAQELLDNGKAKHLETSYLATRSGQHAKVESIAELIFPTEMGGPPSMPNEIRSSVSKTADLTTSQAYTSFTTRNIGTTFSIDPVLGSDRSTIDINMGPEITDFIGWDFHGKEPAQVVQPVVTHLGVSTAISSRKGKAILAGMHTPIDRKSRKPKNGKRVLVFITGAAKEVGK
jgi:hypothetical protein